MRIVSIHTPKAGGTSMLNLWQRTFGMHRVMTDYLDPPANPGAEHALDPEGWAGRRPVSIAEDILVVHGHFKPQKYDLIEHAFRLTMLRHPVDNIISIYFYWKKIPPQPSALHQYFLSRNLSLLEMARLPLLRRLYSETYFGGWDMSRLDFIGRHEDRPAELLRLGKLIGAELTADVHLNATEAGEDDEARARVLADTALVSRLTDVLVDDIRFYEKHLYRAAGG
jgi:hypothetical protein